MIRRIYMFYLEQKLKLAKLNETLVHLITHFPLSIFEESW